MDLTLKTFLILFLCIGCIDFILSQSEITTEPDTTEVDFENSIDDYDTNEVTTIDYDTSEVEVTTIDSDTSEVTTHSDNNDSNATTLEPPPTSATTIKTTPKPVPVASVSKEIDDPESDEFTVTTASCAYFDERCRPVVAGEKPDCSGTANGKDPKPCDPESHLECFESVRHNYQLTCHCRPGTIKNPYDPHRCIPNQNHTRQWGDSCVEADDEKCDVEKFLRCKENTEQKQDNRDRIPSHICVCVEAKFIQVRVLDEASGRSACYINRTDKYLISSHATATCLRIVFNEEGLNLILLMAGLSNLLCRFMYRKI